ncbi:hypothetical protein T06_6034 [Trichinella sp. T6]|nr:hypothetical protein T06_6034 [Trichinella sp. T6]
MTPGQITPTRSVLFRSEQKNNVVDKNSIVVKIVYCCLIIISKCNFEALTYFSPFELKLNVC